MADLGRVVGGVARAKVMELQRCSSGGGSRLAWIPN